MICKRQKKKVSVLIAISNIGIENLFIILVEVFLNISDHGSINNAS